MPQLPSEGIKGCFAMHQGGSDQRLDDTLYPVTKLNDMDINVVIAIRNYRQFLETGHSLDIKQLSRMLGMPAIAGCV